jgi:hypothetical protein
VNPVWQSHHSRSSHGKAVTGQKRLSFALEFVVSISRDAGVAELADALDSKASGLLHKCLIIKHR